VLQGWYLGQEGHLKSAKLTVRAPATPLPK
jgi:hypothetical protein